MSEVRKIPLYQALARDLAWLRQVNDAFLGVAEEQLEYHESFLPSGNGFDAGCVVDTEESRDNKTVIRTSYHHMDENGFYDGWTDLTIVITPHLVDRFRIKIAGRDRNNLKDYVWEVFWHALTAEVNEYKPKGSIMKYNLESSMSDRVNFDAMVERSIEEDQEIGGYSAEVYAAEIWSSISDQIEDGLVQIDDLDEAQSRVKAVVARELPRIQAERAEVENEYHPD